MLLRKSLRLLYIRHQLQLPAPQAMHSVRRHPGISSIETVPLKARSTNRLTVVVLRNERAAVIASTLRHLGTVFCSSLTVEVKSRTAMSSFNHVHSPMTSQPVGYLGHGLCVVLQSIWSTQRHRWSPTSFSLCIAWCATTRMPSRRSAHFCLFFSSICRTPWITAFGRFFACKPRWFSA